MKKQELATKPETAPEIEDKNIDLSEVVDGMRLKRNKLGVYVSPDVEGISFTTLEARIHFGKPKYILWGKEDKNPDHKGKLFLEADNKEKAEELFSQLCISEDLTDHGYSFSDVDERYIILFEDVRSGAPYFIDMSKSAKKEFLNYAKAIRYGLLGNKNRNLSGVVTTITTQEKKSGTLSWLCEKFTFKEDIQ